MKRTDKRHSVQHYKHILLQVYFTEHLNIWSEWHRHKWKRISSEV